MEHLTKQQIVLLTLLVSFVTSLATGIITVSLMDQGTIGITQTINRVIERTVEKVVMETPESGAAAVVTAPTLAQIVEKNSQAIIRIKPGNGTAADVTGLGVLLTPEGLILTDKSTVGLPGDGTVRPSYNAIASTGEEFPLQILQTEIIGDVAFAALIVPVNKKLTPVIWSGKTTSIKLGETVYALSGKNSSVLETGIITKRGEKVDDPVETSIASDKILLGSPLFTASGEVIGYKTKALLGTGSFYPVSVLHALAPQISR